MKIALVIFHDDPSRGGAERYTVDLAAALTCHGENVSLISSQSHPSHSPPPASTYRTIKLRSAGLTRTQRYHSFLRSLDAHLDAEAYDIVHAMLPVRRCHVYHPHAGLAAEALVRGHQKYSSPLKRSFARVANRLNWRRRAFTRIERQLLSSSNPPVVLCLSEYVKSAVRRHYKLPDDRLVTLFNAIDLEKFDPEARPQAGRELRANLHIPPDRVVALIIAQDFQRKGLKEAIVATAHLNEPRLLLLVVGKEDPAEYRRFAKNLRIEHQVHFAGPTADPYAFYKAADFFVLPTRHDPCSLVVLEALVMGLPLISTAQNGACEVMTQGREGFILPDPADTRKLAEAMQKMLDPTLRRAMSSAALALRQKLSHATHLQGLLALYHQILQQKRPFSAPPARL